MAMDPSLVTEVIEVAAGRTASLRCTSNDDAHNFMFWQLGQNGIVGPGNAYDENKYKYQVLSGRLLIKDIRPEESGFYRCVSKNMERGSLNVGAIEMLVKPQGAAGAIEVDDDSDSDMEIVKIIFIIISTLVLVVCGFMFYRLRKAEKKVARKLAAFDEDDDEGSGDEIYNRTTTVINDAVPGPSTYSKDTITGIDNQGLDTDFNAAFEQIAINVANRNLV